MLHQPMIDEKESQFAPIDNIYFVKNAAQMMLYGLYAKSVFTGYFRI